MREGAGADACLLRLEDGDAHRGDDAAHLRTQLIDDLVLLALGLANDEAHDVRGEVTVAVAPRELLE